MKTRIVTIYRDDSTTQVVYDRVKHFFWLANNTVLCIARLHEEGKPEHYYIHWPRERFCWFKDEPNQEPPTT
jgi:hypothetical protein